MPQDTPSARGRRSHPGSGTVRASSLNREPHKVVNRWENATPTETCSTIHTIPEFSLSSSQHPLYTELLWLVSWLALLFVYALAQFVSMNVEFVHVCIHQYELRLHVLPTVCVSAGSLGSTAADLKLTALQTRSSTSSSSQPCWVQRTLESASRASTS